MNLFIIFSILDFFDFVVLEFFLVFHKVYNGGTDAVFAKELNAEFVLFRAYSYHTEWNARRVSVFSANAEEPRFTLLHHLLF